MNYKDVNLILKQLKLKPKRRLGQNFLIDWTISNKIINLSEVSNNDTILEIGPGLGALTEHLIERARKVIAVEIDPNLSKYLTEKFSTNDNIEIISNDILKIDIPLHNKVISNIPYTITGPIFEKIFYKEKAPQGILTIEEKIANRIFFPEDYKNISRISIGLNNFMTPVSRFTIPRKSFYPIPNIDISLIKIVPKKNINPFLLEKKTKDYFLKFIAGIMPYKNKNIANALYLFSKTQETRILVKNEIMKILYENNYKNKKVFMFKINEFMELSQLFYTVNRQE